jgi:hypothetical protein
MLTDAWTLGSLDYGARASAPVTRCSRWSPTDELSR